MNKPILLATDGSSTAGEAAKTAIELAGALHAPLVVASVWDVTYEPIGVGFGPILPDVDKIGHDQASRVVEEAAGPAREAGLEVEAVIARGRPVDRICAIAAEHDARLIVIGSHGWGVVRRALFGSVSTGVLHHAHQPVLVVPAARTTGVDEPMARETLAV
jgi:nucleotide-binding universal stress UspA family protein